MVELAAFCRGHGVAGVTLAGGVLAEFTLNLDTGFLQVEDAVRQGANFVDTSSDHRGDQAFFDEVLEDGFSLGGSWVSLLFHNTKFQDSKPTGRLVWGNSRKFPRYSGGRLFHRFVKNLGGVAIGDTNGNLGEN